MPAANIKEQEEAFTIEMGVPGMSKKDFHIDVDNNILTISSEKEEESKEALIAWMKASFLISALRKK